MYGAQLGSSDAYYGNIQLGSWSLQPQNYGGWPDWGKQELKPVLPEVEAVQVVEPEKPVDNSALIAANIAVIKELRAELAATEETQKRIAIRADIEAAQKEKARLFRIAAQVDEEESLFLLM